MADADFWHRVLLIDFDGADAATAATDASRFNHTLTFNGGAELDTAIKTYGTASLLLDGVDSYVSILNANFGRELVPYRNPFCVEFEYTKTTDPGDQTFCGQWNENGDRCWRIVWISASTLVRFEYSNIGSATTYKAGFDTSVDAAGAIDLFDGSPHHIAAYRLANGNIYIAVDGNVGGTTGGNTRYVDVQPAVPVTIGCDFSSGGAAQNFCTGNIDAFRMTMGIEEYTATTGSFTEPSAAHDTVDAGEGAAYSYPLTVNIFNGGAENSSDYPWEVRQESHEHGMSPTISGGHAAPRTGTYFFTPGGISLSQLPVNFTGTSAFLEIDLSRYDSQFVDDIDAGILEITWSNYAYIENLGDGHQMLAVEFLNVSDEVIAAEDGDGFIPGTAASWLADTMTAHIPKTARKVRLLYHAAKEANAYADTRIFADDFACSINRKSDYLTDEHTVGRFDDADSMVANWTTAGSGLAIVNLDTSQGKIRGDVTEDLTAVGTDVEVTSPVFDLSSDTTDIDAGSVDYRATLTFANDVDTCQYFIDFYEADGTTQVGSRIATTLGTHLDTGELVTLSGTIPATAEKAQLGILTTSGASGSDFRARNALFYENGPAPAAPGAGGGGASIALGLALVIGGD